MAYNPQPRQRPPPSRQMGGQSVPNDGRQYMGYKPELEGRNQLPLQGSWQSNGRPGDSFSPHDEYKNYNQNPWANDPGGQGEHDAAYVAHEQQGYSDHGYYPAPQNQSRNPTQPHSLHPRDKQTPRKASRPYDDDQRYGERYGSSQGQYNGAQSEQQQDHYEPGAPWAPASYPQQFQSQSHVHDRNAAPDEDSDSLPRYMNGHAHRFSNDNHHTPRGFERPGHDLKDGARQRPYDPPLSGQTSYQRPSFEQGAPMGRPQTAEGYRRKAKSPPHADQAYTQRAGMNRSATDGFGHHDSSANHGLDSMSHNYPGHAGYGRSQTMPAAIPEPTSDPGLIPVDNQTFQEPGAVSGFYGSHRDDPRQERPMDTSRSHSGNQRWASAARPVQKHVPAHDLSAAESYGEFGNIDQSHAAKPYAPFRNRRPSNPRFPSSEDEMPNFDASAPNDQRGRDPSFGDHLQPNPAQESNQYFNGPPHSHSSRPGETPRSRSQPDFYAQQPYARPADGMDNIRPRPAPYDRPATSAGARDNQQLPMRGPHGFPNRTRVPGARDYEPQALHDQWSGETIGRPDRGEDVSRSQGHGSCENRRDRIPPAPPSHAKPPSSARQSPGPRQPSSGPLAGTTRQQTQQPERFRSPPAQQRNGPPHPAQTYEEGRSPPPANNAIASNGKPGLNSKPPGAKHKGQTLSLDKPLPNPDALPYHPAPIRPGLSAPPSASNTRPAPVRQYNSTSSDPLQHSASQASNGRRHNNPVTSQELEHLRQKTLRNPTDSPMQFQLAQKLVEAADVLVDERSDQATKRRNRDRYQADALKIIKKLSALSYTEADFYYADCYSRGALGLPSDIKEAFLLYQKAAKANHAQAAYRVAVCCELGQEDGGGTKRDPVKAIQWYRRAATLGDVASKYKLGVILLKGLLGQPRNPQEGVGWLKQAADQADKENPHALHELALLHEKGSATDGVRQDEAYARQSFTQAANLGYKFSQFRLGCAYEYGLLGCPVDPRQSIAWYSKAAVQEEHQSELALSGWYLTGAEGVLQQSDTEAYLWARKAAQAGLAKAEYAMGYFTEVGIGAPANLDDAKRWYWKSASQNFPKARDRLEDLRRGGGPKQKTRMSRTNMRKQSDGECTVM